MSSGPKQPMLNTELAVLLVADANVDQWLHLIRQADADVRVDCVPILKAVPEHAAALPIGVLCMDGALTAQNSVSFVEEMVTGAHLKPLTPIVLLTNDATIAERYRSQKCIGTVLLCRNDAERAACVAEFRALLMQTRMQAQLQLFAAALDGTANGLLVIDAHGKDALIVFANAAFSDITGYSNAEVLGHNMRLLYGADTSSETVAELNVALSEAREYSAELVTYRKDGTPFWNQLSVRPLRTTTGQLQYWVATQEDVTERRRMRERLRASEARLELAMSASELAMWDWNVVSGEIFYNNQWQALLELPAEELLLRESLAARLAMPEDDPSIFLDLEKHLVGETPRFEREFEMRTASGKSKSITARANVVRRDAQGQAARVIGVWRDTTARKASLKTIEETHRRWERAVAGTSDGLFDWDLVTGYVWYAPRLREQLGYNEHEFNETFTALQRVLHDDERISVLTKIRAHLEQRAPLDLRCRALCKSGEYRWFRLRGSAERDAAGRPRRLSGSMRDISGQIDAEQALHRSEDFFGAILNALPLTVAYIDRSETVVYANSASGELMGKDVESIRGRALGEVLNADLFLDLAPPLAIAFRGEIVERQLHTQDTNGEPMDIDLTYLPHRNDAGEVQGCFLMARNITTRVRLEAELRQSQKLEAIGKLTGGIAHDFNNLLSVAIGNAQLLSRTLKDSPRLHKQAETILRAAMRGAELTRRLLSFARQQQASLQVTQVNDLVGGMYELLRRTLPNDIEMAMQLDPSVCITKLDHGQFENALLNLVINARDAMPQGGSIHVTTSNVLIDASRTDIQATAREKIPYGTYACITVADTGTGMTADVLKRVFEPFFTTKEFGKGSGLGLAMVNGFAKSCSGVVAIESEVGVGTKVHLYLPRTNEVTVEVESTTIVTFDMPRGTETILVVDDNADVRSTAVEMLHSLGYRVYEADNGRAALAVSESEDRIDLVFADAMLSGGISSANMIRKLRDKHPHIRALLTTGFSESMITHRSLLDGTIAVLHKPYQLSELARHMRTALDREEERVRVQA
jgi:PAS domain S-box-containing protein